MAKSDYYRAKHAFGVNFEGADVTVPAGEIVPKGSPLLKQIGKAGVEEHFEEIESFGQWDPPPKEKAEPKPKPKVREAPVEEATAAPGKKRS